MEKLWQMQGLLSLTLLLVHALLCSHCFVFDLNSPAGFRWQSVTKSKPSVMPSWSLQSLHPCLFQLGASSSSTTSLSSDDEIIVIDWEGCMANTVDWRIRTGIKAALMTWPELGEKYQKFCGASQDMEGCWLHNKLAALAHVFDPPMDQSDNTQYYSICCEYALAVRLLLEEQELDQGRSVGKSGRYASRYHPRQSGPIEGSSTLSFQTKSQSGRRKIQRPMPKHATRPLTVGEISVNWGEGGLIRDTLRTRYHINYRDPMPILQEHVQLVIEMGNESICIDSSVSEALNECTQKVIVAVNHQSDVDVAMTSLRAACLNVAMADIAQKATQSEKGNVVLMCKTPTMVRDLLESCTSASTLYVVESSWYALLREIHLYGDNIPRHPMGVGKSAFGSKQRLSLSLAQWATTTHQNQHSAATMNPWTHLMSLSEFCEFASARIIKH